MNVQNFNSILNIIFKWIYKMFCFPKWANVKRFRTGRTVIPQMHLQITTGFHFHPGRPASFPGSGVIILTSYNSGIPSNANKCNANVIFCGLDSVKMLLEKQCLTEYKHTHKESLEMPFLKPLVKLLFCNQLEILNYHGTLKCLERKLIFLPGTDSAPFRYWSKSSDIWL